MVADGDPRLLVDIPSKLLDGVVDAWAKIGVEFPLLVIQLSLLMLVLLLLYTLLRRMRKDLQNAGSFSLVTAGALGLMALGILFSFFQELFFPLPRDVGGKVKAASLHEVHVQLLDFRGHSISSNELVDSDNGAFSLPYQSTLRDRPRRLRVTAPGCEPQDFSLERTQLRAGSAIEVEFSCRRKP
jgi:hypothetical protein